MFVLTSLQIYDIIHILDNISFFKSNFEYVISLGILTSSDMDDSPPFCRHCRQIYSKINEPIYIVCLCEEKLKYSHGSCFRDWLTQHDYGVCEVCLTKTRIVSDGFKPFKQIKLPTTDKKIILSIIFTIFWLVVLLGCLVWLLIEQCWKAHCIGILVVCFVFLIISLISCCAVKSSKQFWEAFSVNNRYWKIVYCRETKSGRKSIWKYSDVPHSIPWETNPSANLYKDNLSEVGIESKIYEDDKTIEGNDEEGTDGKDGDTGIIFPSIWTPRNYPYVKKNPVYSTLERNQSNSLRPTNTRGRHQRYSIASQIEMSKDEDTFIRSYTDHQNNILNLKSSNNMDIEPSMLNSTVEKNKINDDKISKEGEGSSENESDSDDGYFVLNASGEKVINSRIATEEHADGVVDTIVREASKGLSYIDSRADSFYSANSHRGINIHELRNNLKKSRRSYAVSQYDLSRQSNDAKSRGFKAMYRALSEPNVSKSKQRRFSKYFKHDDDDVDDVDGRKLHDDGAIGKIKNLIRGSSKKGRTKEELMPHQSDVVYKAMPSDLLVNVRDAKSAQSSRDPHSRRTSLQGSISMPTHREYPEQPHLFEKHLEIYTPDFHQSFTPEPKPKPTSDDMLKNDRIENVEKPADSANNVTTTASHEEIERILTTPLHELDVSELFDVNAPIAKKQRTSLFRGGDGTSLFYAPS